eukprot:XP_002259854.1 hypothetical protein, conserved in Plasmodium species [Plasmodium knowlesi strain H]
MLHLNSTCISDIEHIERALRKKDYEGIKTSAEIKSVFENLGEAFKSFSDSLKKIHSDGNAIIANIKKRHKEDEEEDGGDSSRVYLADCFVNVVTLVHNLYEENLSISEKIKKNIVLELEKEETERVQEISSIYKEEDAGSTNLNENCVGETQEGELSTGERWECQKGRTNPHENISHEKGTIIHGGKTEELHKEDYTHKHEILVDGIPLRQIEIDLKRCLENELFAKEYLNSAKYKKHFSELDKLNIKLDKEIDALKEILEKFGKNANKMLINKSKERINSIQIRKKELLEILYDNIKELRYNKRTMRCSIKDLEEYVQDNVSRRKKWQDRDPRNAGREKQNGDATKEATSPPNTEDQKEEKKKTPKRLNLDKFEIREKYRIEKIYSSVRGFIKILAVEHIHMNSLLYKGACQISSYDSLIDYQMWLSLVLRKNVDIADLQMKIPQNDVLSEEEQFRLMPHRGDSPAGDVQNMPEKKRKMEEQNFRSGELICVEKSSSGGEEERKKQKDLQHGGETEKEQTEHAPHGGNRASSQRDGQFPEKFYIPMIIERNTYRGEDNSTSNGKEAKWTKNMGQPQVNSFVGEKYDETCLTGKSSPRKEKDIFSFLTNRQKECEKYMLQFNRVDILSTMLSKKTRDKRRWYHQNFFQSYFFEEGHPFYPFRIPPSINNFSTFEKWPSTASSPMIPLFEEEEMNEYEYKLIAYESLLLVYYYLSTQLNSYFLFDMSKRNKLNKEVYNEFYERCSPMLEKIQGKKKQTSTYAERSNQEKYKCTPPASSNRGYTLKDHFEYVDYIYNVKLQNLLLVKRITSIYRIKLNLDSRTNDLITLLTIPSHYTNWGYTYSFHVLDVRFRILRIMESLNFNNIFHVDVEKLRKEKNPTGQVPISEESTIYTSWLKRQLQLLNISVYFKFCTFVKFVPFFDSHSHSYFKDMIYHFQKNGEYFSYLSRGSSDNPFVSYLRTVQKKIKKLYWFVLHQRGKTEGVISSQQEMTDKNKRHDKETDESKHDQRKNEETNFVTFKSLRRDEQIIFLCNLLLKNLIKSFRLISFLKILVKENKWNTGVCDEKKKLANLVKYFTKIEYYDYEVKKIIICHREEEQDHSYQDQSSGKYPCNEYGGKTKEGCDPKWDDQNIDHDELYKEIFMKEFSKFVKVGKNGAAHGATPSNEARLIQREKKVGSKIFYKINVETVLCSSWFIDRSLLHFFLYYYISCVIGTSEKTNMYADMPYLMQGIMLILYYLQAGNDLALKGKTKRFSYGVEPTPIPISTFILYLGIHLFYSFFDKNLLTVHQNGDDGNVKLFLRTHSQIHNDEKESKWNHMESYFSSMTPSPRKSQIITVQNASQFCFVIKNFESILSYRTVNAMDMKNGEKGFLGEKTDADLQEVMDMLYADDSSGEEVIEKTSNMTKYSKKKFLFCATVPSDHDKFEDPDSQDNILTRKEAEKKQQNELIYLKRYYNILLHFNYNHLENLISTYVPNVLSLHGKGELYSKDHFFFDWYMKNDNYMKVPSVGDETSGHVRFGASITGESKREDSPQMEYPDHHPDANNRKGSNTTSTVYHKQSNPIRTDAEAEKYQNWDPSTCNTLVIKYRTHEKIHANFSLINLSRIEKVMTDILLMRMLSCDFRDHFILLLCNYRKFIDMYSLPYVLDVFVMLRRFFTINNNSSEEKSNRLKYLHGVRTSHTGNVRHARYARLRRTQESNITLFERSCNVLVEDDLGDKECHSEKHLDGNSPTSTVQEVTKEKGARHASPTHGIIGSEHELSSFFKFFIFNTVKNIFFNIVCIVREDIEVGEMLKKQENGHSESGEALHWTNGEVEGSPFLRAQRGSPEKEENESDRGDIRDSRNDDDMLNCTAPEVQDPLTNQYVDIINKYINEVFAEILFFSSIWKEYLPPEEHPLMVLFAANRTLYYEVSKFLGINKNNNDVLFSQALSIVASLYNFNLLIKEIVLQTNTYDMYQCLVNEKPLDFGVSTGKMSTKKDRADARSSPVVEDTHRTNSPRRKIQNKIAKYYETRNSMRGHGDKGQQNRAEDQSDNKSDDQPDNQPDNQPDDQPDDRFINLSLIISNASDPCMVKLMFKLEKIFIQIMDQKLEHNKKLLSICLGKEKLVPLNSPDIMYNSTCVDIFSIIWSILDVLLEYKCPIEWIITPFVQFLNTFINDYCENYKKKYTSFIISVMNQYADKYFQDLLNLTEQQRIQWDKISRTNIKRRNRKEGDKADDEPAGGTIFKQNELDMLDHEEEEEQDDLILYNENIENEFDDVNEITKRIKYKKRKKNVLYKLFDYEEIDVNAIKTKVGELLEDINDLSVKVSPFQSSSPSKLGKESAQVDVGPSGTTQFNPSKEENAEPTREEKKTGEYMSDDLVNIIDEINHLFNNSDMSSSVVITWNLFFFQEQVALIRNKFEKYIVDYICARTQGVDKLSRLFNNYVSVDIDLPMLQRNIYTKTILDILNTSISNIRDTLKNTLYFIFKVLSIRMVCYEFQREVFFNLYEEPFDTNNIQSIVAIFPNTVEKFILQIPESFRKSILTVFIELFIKMWILVVVEKGFSSYIFNDNDIHMMKRDNQCIRKYMKQKGIELSHLFLTKKYDVTEYIDTFFDSLYADRHLFLQIISEQKERKPKNIMSSAYNKGM